MEYRGYVLGQEIGAGAHSKVYAAVKQINNTQMRCAVKVIETLDGLSDAATIGRLNHPNIAACYDIDADLSGALLYMELLSPVALDLRTREAVRLSRDVASALSVCHSLGVVYGRVCLSNVLRHDNGAYKLADAATRIKSREGDVGQDALMSSPEVLRGEPLTPGADIYALGVLLYRLINNGAYPFVDDAHDLPRAMSAALVGRTPDQPPNAPDALYNIAVKAMKSTSERYKTADQMRIDLDTYLEFGERKTLAQRIAEIRSQPESVPIVPDIAPEPAPEPMPEPMPENAPPPAIRPRGFGMAEKKKRGVGGWLAIGALLAVTTCLAVFGAYFTMQFLSGNALNLINVWNDLTALRLTLPENSILDEPTGTPLPTETHPVVLITPRNAPQKTARATDAPEMVQMTEETVRKYAEDLAQSGAVTLIDEDLRTVMSLDEEETLLLYGDHPGIEKRGEPTIDVSEYPSLAGFLLPSGGRIVHIAQNAVASRDDGAGMSETQLILRCATIADVTAYRGALKKAGWLTADAPSTEQTAFAMYQKNHRFIVIDYFTTQDEYTVSMNLVE